MKAAFLFFYHDVENVLNVFNLFMLAMKDFHKRNKLKKDFNSGNRRTVQKTNQMCGCVNTFSENKSIVEEWSLHLLYAIAMKHYSHAWLTDDANAKM